MMSLCSGGDRLDRAIECGDVPARQGLALGRVEAVPAMRCDQRHLRGEAPHELGLGNGMGTAADQSNRAVRHLEAIAHRTIAQ